MAVDIVREVRKGEELPKSLSEYLAEHCPQIGQLYDVQQFPGGHSNLTYLLTSDNGEFVLRRPPMGLEIKSAHDMGREYKMLSHLQGHYSKIPEVLHFCDNKEVIGADFYVMQRLSGIILRKATAPDGIDLGPNIMRSLSTNVAVNLADLHSVDYNAAGLGDYGKPDGFVHRQITGWTRRYGDAKTDDIPDMGTVAKWLADNEPTDRGKPSVIHGDYKYDNLMLDPSDVTEIIALFDWEMSTIGEPLMDLGTALSLWVDPTDPSEFQMMPFGPTALDGNLNRREFAQRYGQASGTDVSNVLYFYVFGLFKMAAVFQQIYKRYSLGISKDERFAMMIYGVRAFATQAARAIELGRIDQLE